MGRTWSGLSFYISQNFYIVCAVRPLLLNPPCDGGRRQFCCRTKKQVCRESSGCVMTPAFSYAWVIDVGQVTPFSQCRHTRLSGEFSVSSKHLDCDLKSSNSLKPADKKQLFLFILPGECTANLCSTSVLNIGHLLSCKVSLLFLFLFVFVRETHFSHLFQAQLSGDLMRNSAITQM